MRTKLCLSFVAFFQLCAVSMAQEKPATVRSASSAYHFVNWNAAFAVKVLHLNHQDSRIAKLGPEKSIQTLLSLNWQN